MAPNLFGNSATLYLEASQQDVLQEKSSTEKVAQKIPTQKAQSQQRKYQWRIVWRNVIAFVYLHLGALYGFYLVFTSAKLLTILFMLFVTIAAGLGITAGAHRLWAHRSYKAKWPLRLLLMVLQTTAFQNHIYEWVRDHRVHHKYTDTDADPHNAQRGFFFSHMGWLMLRKHPDVMKKGATIDMSDLDKDPIVVWQRRLYIILMPIFCFLIPTWVPIYFWNEKPMISWYVTLLRYAMSLNITWLINSAAHMYGMKPYDRNISPTDSFRVALPAFGEGWHNYHHVFPYDYKAAELGDYQANLTLAFIDLSASLGLAYDLKTIPKQWIERRAKRTGDGSRCPLAEEHEHSHEGAIWGWGDVDMDPSDMKETFIINKGD